MLIFCSVMAAMIAQNIERHIVLGGKYAEASSSVNSTPPIGAPNAT